MRDVPPRALLSPCMTDDHERKPTQKTQPKKGEPVEIPVSKISTFRAAIRKVAQPVEREHDERTDRQA